MIRRLKFAVLGTKFAVLGTLTATLVVYFVIFNRSHLSTPCTSRDCGASNHVRRILPAGSAQPHIRRQDTDGVPETISQNSMGKEQSVDVRKHDYARGGELKHQTDINNAETETNLKFTGKLDDYSDEPDYADLDSAPSKHERTRAAFPNSKKIETSESDIRDGVASVADPVSDPVEGLLAGMQAALKQDPRQDSSRNKVQHANTRDQNNTKLPSADVIGTNLLPPDNITEPHIVRECVSGDVLGVVAKPLQIVPIASDPLDPSGTEESPRDRQKSFQHVFKTRAWGHGWDQNNKGLNASGMGSTLLWSQEMIATLHKVIDDVKKTLGISRVTLLDVPCGDLVWMHRFLQTRDDIMYTGMDIVPELIWHHQRTYPMSEYPRRRFVHGDIVTIPELGRYHVVLCRMMMQHLPYFDVYQVQQKISSSGSLYALMTTINTKKNEQLHLENIAENPGRFRGLNLEIPPYRLEPPLCLQRDGPPDVFQGWDHFIGLWKLPLRRFKDCRQIYQNRWKDSPHLLYSCTLWNT